MQTTTSQAHITPDVQVNSGSIADNYLKKNILNNAVFSSSSSSDTVVSSIIKVFSDTLVFDGVSSHSVSAKRQYQEDEADLFAVLSSYEKEEFPKIKNYLKSNDDLVEFLAQLPDQVCNLEGVDSLKLEFYHDIEEHWDKLYVTVNTQIEDTDGLDALENHLYSSFFEPKTDMLSGRVVLSVG